VSLRPVGASSKRSLVGYADEQSLLVTLAGTHTIKISGPALVSWLRRPGPPAAMVQGLICVHMLADLRN